MKWALAFAAMFATTRVADACEGCVLVEAGEGKRPLVVLLHGDEGTPHKLVGAWKAAAAARGVVLFAPRCPKREGCAGSWWRWDGDPAWLIARVEELQDIDPDRRYLAGWSGGASYMGAHGSRWFDTFAAISLAGGGKPPSSPACFARPECAPVHHLAGDENPLFGLQEATRDYFAGCGHAVEWDLRRGANHGGEWRHYSAAIGSILEWLLARPACKAPTPMPVASTSAPAPPPASTPRCSCSMPAGSPSPWWLLLLVCPGFRRRHVS